MSITPKMQAAARSAYRNLYRAASTTFAGDDHVLKAFRMKMRNDALAARAIVDPETYEQQSQFGRDIADVLRRNVVQGVRVNSGNDPQGGDTFKLRLTKDTELGSNDTIKNPPPIERSNRSARRREKTSQGQNSVVDVAQHNESSSPPQVSLNYSQLKKAHSERVVPELREEDLEESFVRGSGPGGQSINKTENNVQLLHKPTGIRVTCQETRSLTLNRRLARRNLLEKLDKIANPGLSKEDFSRAKQRERERRRRKKAKKKALEKASEEDEVDEGLEEPEELPNDSKAPSPKAVLDSLQKLR